MPRKARRDKFTHAQALAALPRVVSVREDARAEFYARNEVLQSAFRAMSLAQRNLANANRAADKIQSIVDLGPEAKKVINERVVDAPRLTDAEYRHQVELEAQGGQDASLYHTDESANVAPGKIKASINMDLFIGGFSQFKRRTEAQEITASRFLSAYEMSQVSSARGTDYAQPLVDTSGASQDAISAAQEDAAAIYRDAVQFLGMVKSSLLERVIVGRLSCSRIAAERAGKVVTGRPVGEVAQQVRNILDELCDHWHVRGDVAPRQAGEHQSWSDGSRVTKVA